MLKEERLMNLEDILKRVTYELKAIPSVASLDCFHIKYYFIINLNVHNSKFRLVIQHSTNFYERQKNLITLQF